MGERMTDRVASLTVIFEHDLRDDDVQPIVDAISQLRGVLDVRPTVIGTDHVVAKAQARGEIFARLTKVIADYV